MRKKKLLDRRIFVCRLLSNNGSNRIRAPPGLEFEFKIKFQIKEDKSVKYAPKKVFILENGLYKEITYSELKQLEQADKSYMDKLFLPLHGMLMEVTEETYKEYYRDKRRQKYIDERSKLNGDVSYNALDTDEMLGENVFADTKTDVEAEVINKMTVAELRKAFLLLSPDEKALIVEHFFDEKSQIELSKQYGVNQSNISRKINRIISKLKKFLEN